MIPRMFLATGVGLCLLVTAEVAVPEAPIPPTVSLEKAVHFMNSEGGDVLVGPGTYRIEQAAENRLRLVPEQQQEPLVLQATAISHPEQISLPVAKAIRRGEDEYHVALLLPEGKGLEAVGSYSGVRTRAELALVYTPLTCTITRYSPTAPVVPPTHNLWLVGPEFAAAIPPNTAATLPIMYDFTPTSVVAWKPSGDTSPEREAMITAPISLPVGARIQEVELRATDKDSLRELTVFVAARIATGESTSGGVSVVHIRTNCLSGYGTVTASGLAHPMDGRYPYYVQVRWTVTKAYAYLMPPDIVLRGVRIGYTLQ